jgi:hypothetical protein
MGKEAKNTNDLLQAVCDVASGGGFDAADLCAQVTAQLGPADGMEEAKEAPAEEPDNR